MCCQIIDNEHFMFSRAHLGEKSAYCTRSITISACMCYISSYHKALSILYDVHPVFLNKKLSVDI